MAMRFQSPLVYVTIAVGIIFSCLKIQADVVLLSIHSLLMDATNQHVTLCVQEVPTPFVSILLQVSTYYCNLKK